MIIGFLWIVGCYASCIAIAHWLYRRASQQGKLQPVHYVLITCNHQNQIEWVIRSLLFFSQFKGRPIFISVIDEGSSDDTLAIIARLGREQTLNIRLHASAEQGLGMEEGKGEQTVVVRLNQQDSLVTAYKFM